MKTGEKGKPFSHDLQLRVSPLPLSHFHSVPPPPAAAAVLYHRPPAPKPTRPRRRQRPGSNCRAAAKDKGQGSATSSSLPLFNQRDERAAGIKSYQKAAQLRLLSCGPPKTVVSRVQKQTTSTRCRRRGRRSDDMPARRRANVTRLQATPDLDASRRRRLRGLAVDAAA